MLAKVIIENGVKKIQALTADTGVGAPVGSIIVVCSNILPSGYIGLGVQYDITNYPALYQVLGTDTTPTASALGLPTLSSGQYAIKATSGLTENQQENVLNTINENNSYSTEEHPTGKKWIDGKPIYRKVIPFDKTLGYTGVHSTVEIGTIPQNGVLTKMDYYGYTATYDIKVYNNNTLNVIVQGQSIRASQGFANSQIQITGYVIIEYTKTTD